jgi:ADP-dependent NAD(P)H-hydrate dehydratase / NAD(P)H-hydrate epimerase
MPARSSRPGAGAPLRSSRPSSGAAEDADAAPPAGTGVHRPVPLPADDPRLFQLDLRGLRERWAEAMARAPMSAEAMTGADRRAQASGIPGERLMEHAGTAVAAATHALAVATERPPGAPILVLCGPGNNGGDGLVAARRLANAGHPVVVVLVASEARPTTPDAGRNWDRLDGVDGVTRVHAPVGRDVAILGQGIERVGVVVDALLGTGVRGTLREPIRTAVETIQHAREAAVPVVAVDTPTAVDLSSGDPSDPVVRADLTVTFHRPKTGLLTRVGAALAGRVLVAPIGIPQQADPS